MDTNSFDCDTVAHLEEIGVGAAELLEYARTMLPRREIESLLLGLESALERRTTRPEAEAFAVSSTNPVADAVADHAL